MPSRLAVRSTLRRTLSFGVILFACGAEVSQPRTGPNAGREVTLGSGPRHLGYVMHADVVPEGEAAPGDATATPALPAGWTHDPFKAVVDGDQLVGRGVEDDKGPIAAVLVTLAAMA